MLLDQSRQGTLSVGSFFISVEQMENPDSVVSTDMDVNSECPPIFKGGGINEDNGIILVRRYRGAKDVYHLQ